MKHKCIALLILLLLSSMLLTGCTVTADRIYSICKEDGDRVYCYKSTGEFFIFEDGILAPTSDVGLKNYPALNITPMCGAYNFEYVLPGLYKGTLWDVNRYVAKLLETDGSALEISYRDWNLIDAYVKTPDINVRVVYSISGDVRIYAVDSASNPTEPPYLGGD